MIRVEKQVKVILDGVDIERLRDVCEIVRIVLCNEPVIRERIGSYTNLMPVRTFIDQIFEKTG